MHRNGFGRGQGIVPPGEGFLVAGGEDKFLNVCIFNVGILFCDI